MKWLAPEVVQTSSMDCGPAALKCALEGFGIAASYGRLREACQTDVDGTSIDTLEAVANRLGLRAEQECLPVEHLLGTGAAALPALVVVRRADGAAHFVVAWRRHGPWVQLMDPELGRRWVRQRQLAADLLVHTVEVPATDWRDWAGSAAFLGPLAARLGALGCSGGAARALCATATADAGWFSLGALDATTRFVQSLVDVGGVTRGAAAARLATALFEQTRTSPDDIFRAVPLPAWSVWPTGELDGALTLALRGAVAVRLLGRQPAAAELSPELAAALAEPPVHPLATLWGLLRADGLLRPLALAGAVGLAAGGVLIELLLFRGLFDLGWALNLAGQRAAAVAALLAFSGLLLLFEIPIVMEAARYGRQLEMRLRMALLAKLPQLSDRYFASRPVADMAERSHALEAVRAVPALGLRFVQALCGLGFTLTGIALIDRAALLPGLLTVAAAVLLALVWQPFLNERDLRMRSHAAGLNGFCLDALLGLAPIRAHRAERALRRQHEGLLVEWVRAGRATLGLGMVADAMQAVTGLALAGWLLTGHFLRAGGITGADLLLVYWALKLPALGRTLSGLAHQYPAQRNVLGRLLEPLAAPTEPETASGPRPTRPLALNLQNASVVAGGHPILRAVDLAIAPGEHVAIVGPSGAGKSTLVGLCLGWHRLAAGHLLVDGASLAPGALAALRQHIAWVDPAVQLWNRSLIDNLGYASDGPLTRSAAALETAELRPLLQKLPRGLQTALGEGGALLSGGEGQRVRLARALLQDEVRLVLLDEPFRGLDRAQRARLLAEARTWWHDVTLVCVTHDVAETRRFDRVLVVEDGRIVEDGAPARLAAGATRYRALLDAEATLHAGLWEGSDWRRLRVAEGRVSAAPGASRPTAEVSA